MGTRRLWVEDPQSIQQFGERFNRAVQTVDRLLSHPVVQDYFLVLTFPARADGGSVEGGIAKGITSKGEQLSINKAAGRAFEESVVEATKKTEPQLAVLDS